jgi:hypothetical protein
LANSGTLCFVYITRSISEHRHNIINNFFYKHFDEVETGPNSDVTDNLLMNSAVRQLILRKICLKAGRKSKALYLFDPVLSVHTRLPQSACKNTVIHIRWVNKHKRLCICILQFSFLHWFHSASTTSKNHVILNIKSSISCGYHIRQTLFGV